MQENKDYETAIQQYEILAEKERFQKGKCKNHRNLGVPQESKKDAQDDMLVMFSSSEADDMLSSSETDAATKKCNTSIFEVDESTLQPSINFRFFDEEDEVVFIDNEDSENKGKRKRKSRSAQIASQKKTSIRILNEMRHTLDFIEEYNRKSKDGQDVVEEEGEGEEEEAEKEDAINEEKEDNDDFNQKCQGKPNVKKSSRKVQGGGRKTPAANNKSPT